MNHTETADFLFLGAEVLAHVLRQSGSSRGAASLPAKHALKERTEVGIHVLTLLFLEIILFCAVFATVSCHTDDRVRCRAYDHHKHPKLEWLS